jgi:hypothetical protein
MHDPAFQQWVKDVQALPAEKQIEAVSKKLVELNPAFDGKGAENQDVRPPKIENGIVIEFNINTLNVVDISPVRVLAGLQRLSLSASAASRLSDLLPLEVMKLTNLGGANTRVVDLSCLHEMPIRVLNCTASLVCDLSPLIGTPITFLHCDGTPLSDLIPLAKCEKLTTLDVSKTQVTPASVAALQRALPNCKINWDAATSAAASAGNAKPTTPGPGSAGTK